MTKYLILALALLMWACKGGTDMSGAWTVTTAQMDESGGPIPIQLKNMVKMGMPGTRYVLKDDGTFTKSFAHSAGVDEEGKWALKGNTLTLTKANATTEVWEISERDDTSCQARFKATEAGKADMLVSLERKKD